VGGEIENSKSLVLHVHIQRKRRIAHTAKAHLMRDGASATTLRSHPSRPLSSVWPCARAHASPPMPHRSRCGAVRRGAAWRQRSRQQSLGVAEAKEDCGHGDGRRAVCRSNECLCEQGTHTSSQYVSTYAGGASASGRGHLIPSSSSSIAPAAANLGAERAIRPLCTSAPSPANSKQAQHAIDRQAHHRAASATKGDTAQHTRFNVIDGEIWTRRWLPSSLGVRAHCRRHLHRRAKCGVSESFPARVEATSILASVLQLRVRDRRRTPLTRSR
jgi:hypothetical protein